MAEVRPPTSALRLFFRHGGMWLALPLLLGGMLAAISTYMAEQTSGFQQGGVVVAAEVLGTTRTPRLTQGTRYETPGVTVRFETEAGESVVATGEIREELYEALEAGDEITVRYLRDDPQTIEAEAGASARGTLVTAALAAVLLAAWGVVMARSWRFARNAVRVRDTGVRRRARVTEHRAPLMGNEKKPETRLVWKDGAGREAVSLTLSEADARRFPVGCEIATYELPEAGLPSVWEGDVGGDGGAEAD